MTSESLPDEGEEQVPPHLGSDPDPYPGSDVIPGRAPGLGDPAEHPDPVLPEDDEEQSRGFGIAGRDKDSRPVLPKPASGLDRGSGI